MTVNLQSKIITDNNVTLVMDNKTYCITRGHQNWNGVIKALKEKNYDLLPALVNPKAVVNHYADMGFLLQDNKVLYNGQPLEPALSNLLLSLIRDGFDVAPYVNFVKKLETNPSYRAREQLYRFIEANKITLTDSGDLMLYKNVRQGPDGHLYDIHSGTINNDVGRTIRMDRTKVDDNPQNTCSAGLHVCSLGYLKSFSGDVTLLVRVNPRDVVSIPVDYNNSKMRVCEYVVAGIHECGYDREATNRSVISDDMSCFDDDLDGDSYFPDDVSSSF